MILRANIYRQRFGLFAFVGLLFFPITLLITNPIRIVRTLWFAKVLANGQWSQYNRFRPPRGINSLFYWTEALNFDRYGRKGISPYVGTGNYHLGKWWHMSLTSSYLYWRLGAMLPVLSMFGWLGSHVLWIDASHVDALWFMVVILTALVSSYFYASAFVFLNYNSFGWLFMPLGLYGIITENYWIAAFGWFGASLGSFTVLFIAGVLSISWAIFNQSIFPLIALIPSVLKLFSHFLFVEDIMKSLDRVAKGIGLVRGQKVKYKRAANQGLFSSEMQYYLITWGVFCLILWIDSAYSYAVLASTVWFLAIINSAVSRFADPQSLHLAMFSVATPILLLNPSPLLFGLFWIGVSPLPALIGAESLTGRMIGLKSYRPFRVGAIIERCHEFFSEIPKDSRVLLALNDPNNQYSDIFDGYRSNYELAFYTANINKILVFPDWWAIFDNNNFESPDFWGREPNDVIQNCIKWHAEYVIIYQPSGTGLENKWADCGFIEISSFDWGIMLNDHLGGEPCWPDDKPAPKWWLLRMP